MKITSGKIAALDYTQRCEILVKFGAVYLLYYYYWYNFVQKSLCLSKHR